MKNRFVSYADTESLVEKISTCHIDREKLLPRKINKHTACGCSLFT